MIAIKKKKNNIYYEKKLCVFKKITVKLFKK